MGMGWVKERQVKTKGVSGRYRYAEKYFEKFKIRLISSYLSILMLLDPDQR